MSSKKFFYVVVDKLLTPRIAKTQTALFQHLRQHPDSDVKTFFTEEEATKFMQSFEKFSVQTPSDPFKVDLDQIKNSTVLSSLKNKKSEEAQNGGPQNQENNFAKNAKKATRQLEEMEEQSQKTLEFSNEQMEEETNDLQDCIAQVEGTEEEKKKFVWDPFYFFREDAEAIEKAKNKINPKETYYLFFDGACSNNPGPTGAGYIVFDKNSKKIFSNAVFSGMGTNNTAEYYGLIFGMKSCQNIGIKKLQVFGDSQLVTKQMTGKYKVKAPQLLKFYGAGQELLKGFDEITIEYIQREQNAEADALSKKGVTFYKGKKG